MAQPTPEQANYLAVLEDMANMLKKVQINLKKCSKHRLTEGYIKTRKETLEGYWNTFNQANSNLMKCTPREQRGILPYFLNEEFYTYEELYLCLQGDLTELLSSFESQPKTAEDLISSQINQASFAKLPRIQLPTFTGKYEDWPSYQDLFTALVHDTSLSDVQKLYYLKTSVSGEAEMLLRQFQITENKYLLAWKLLQNRFGNKRMMINSILGRIFGQKKIANQSPITFKSLLDTTTECINSLNELNVSTATWSPIIVFLISQKLDQESLKDWEEYTYKENYDELPSWEGMKKFLEYKFRTLELAAPISSFTTRDKYQTSKLGNSFHVTIEKYGFMKFPQKTRMNNPVCVYCNGNHYIFHCKVYGKQSVVDRRELVKEKGLCFNCLSPNHKVFRCKNTARCRVCRKKHHSLLHQGNNKYHTKENQPQLDQSIWNTHLSKRQTDHGVLLATAQVQINSKDGTTHTLRALIDQGSEASFISRESVELLGLDLDGTNIDGVAYGVGEREQIPVKHMIDLSITSRFGKGDSIRVPAYVLETISKKLPSTRITMSWPEVGYLELADPSYYKPSKIHLLLGAEVFCKIIEAGLVKSPEGIIAQKTRLGWILSGQMRNQVSAEK